jgi:hypothetical protein
MDAQSAAVDFRSRRRRPGASPHKPSAAFSHFDFSLGELGTAPSRTVMETLKGFPNPRHLPPALPPPRFARPRATVRAEQSSAAPHAFV